MKETLSIVMPLYREGMATYQVVQRLIKVLEKAKIPFEIIIVAVTRDLITEPTLNSITTFYRNYVRIVFVPRANIAKQIRKGIGEADGSIVTFFTGDDSDMPEDVVRMYEEMTEGVDCVFGSRFMIPGSVFNYPWFKYILNRIGNRLIQALFDCEFNDLTGSMKMYKYNIFHDKWPIISDSFPIHLEMALNALKAKLHIVQIPVRWSGRRFGKSKYKMIKDNLSYLRTAYKVWKDATDMFSKVEYVAFELSNRCNYSAAHPKCPTVAHAPAITLPMTTILCVLETLRKYKYSKVIQYNIYNEPLIDPRLFKIIEMTLQYCPEVTIDILTNGWNLDQVLLDELAEARVKSVRVSLYFEDEAERLTKLIPKSELYYTCFLSPLDDRMSYYKGTDHEKKLICTMPDRYVFITNDSKVSLCCIDGFRWHNLGDLKEQSLETIMQSEFRKCIIAELSKGNRSLSLCKKCVWPFAEG